MPPKKGAKRGRGEMTNDEYDFERATKFKRLEDPDGRQYDPRDPMYRAGDLPDDTQTDLILRLQKAESLADRYRKETDRVSKMLDGMTEQNTRLREANDHWRFDYNQLLQENATLEQQVAHLRNSLRKCQEMIRSTPAVL